MKRNDIVREDPPSPKRPRTEPPAIPLAPVLALASFIAGDIAPELLAAHVVPLAPTPDIRYYSPWELRSQYDWLSFGTRLALALCSKRHFAWLKDALFPVTQRVFSVLCECDVQPGHRTQRLSVIATFGGLKHIAPYCDSLHKLLCGVPAIDIYAFRAALDLTHIRETEHGRTAANWLRSVALGNPNALSLVIRHWKPWFRYSADNRLRQALNTLMGMPQFLCHGNAALFNNFYNLDPRMYQTDVDFKPIISDAALPIVKSWFPEIAWIFRYEPSAVLKAAQGNKDARVLPWLTRAFANLKLMDS
jgi:hypothetical protein